ncbi:MAG TPA: class I SAM-dependent methyltransferase [Alphaproteobacteria bacterium]|nr:class I SAM-dependent methyltransferase [Alphaproteobacteria bacterium]
MSDGTTEATPKARVSSWRTAIPWWVKITAKVALSRLPVSGRVWQQLRIFSPGDMLLPDYAIGVFRAHYQRAGRPAPGFTYLELGPGDSLATAAVAWAHGAAGGWLVDAGAYAARDIDLYRPLLDRLAEQHEALGLLRDVRGLKDCGSVAELLERTGCRFRENGLADLKAIPEGSIDFVLSQATLEHVPRAEFAATMRELYRLMKPGAASSHQIDFKDHLGGSLHNLHFSEGFWEKPWFARRSGFYTNRLQLSDVLRDMAAAGFAVEIVQKETWDALPVEKSRLAMPFRERSDEDLKTKSAELIAKKHA